VPPEQRAWFGAGPDVIVRDNDNRFGTEFDRVAKGAGMKVVPTAVRAPLMNARCERFLGSVGREWKQSRLALATQSRQVGFIGAICIRARGKAFLLQSSGRSSEPFRTHLHRNQNEERHDRRSAKPNERE